VTLETEEILAICVTFVLCGCQILSPTLREEHRLRVFESRVLRRIFGPKGQEDREKYENKNFII
jgi:hypothetical protein